MGEDDERGVKCPGCASKKVERRFSSFREFGPWLTGTAAALLAVEMLLASSWLRSARRLSRFPFIIHLRAHAQRRSHQSQHKHKAN